MKAWRHGFALAALAVALCGCTPPAGRDVLYQTSTLGALMEGVYDGDMSVGTLRRQGDIGLGTFDALDGEMVVLDGTVYQVTSDGWARRAADDATTPFAAVTWFEADVQFDLSDVGSLAALCSAVDAKLPGNNVMYAVRIDGEFDTVKVRSVPRQSKPYPRLVEVAKRQPVFEHEHVRGTLVGFRLPGYVGGLNVPGYHLHFIDEGRTIGGHVLECRLRRGSAAVDVTTELYLRLPEGEGFAKADLSRGTDGEVHAVEK